MNKITSDTGKIKLEGGISGEGFKLFNERNEFVLDTYTELLSSKNETTFSHLTGLSCSKLKNYENIHVHFIKTNEVYTSALESNKHTTVHQSIPGIPKTVTHIAFTDIFGRVSRFEQTSEDLPDFYSLFYGIDKDCENTEHLWFKTDHRLLIPFGNLISGRNMLSVDLLGFKLAKSKRLIWDLGSDNSDCIDIGIVGGSFVHGEYSLPGESFSEILEKLLNFNDCSNSNTKRFRVWNLSMPGHVQIDSFSLLMNSSLIKRFKIILWIDGVNDLFTTTNFDSIGLPNIPVPLPVKWNGIELDQKLRVTINDGDRINLYIKYRKYICEIIKALNIKCINVLQPTINFKNPNHRKIISALFPYHSKLAWGGFHKAYAKSIPHIQQLGELENLEFHSYKEDATNPLDFWDFVHLSPQGEVQYAEYLKELVLQSINHF